MGVIFFIVIITLNFAEYKLYRTLFNPFSIISLMYTFLILYNNYIATYYGFYRVSIGSLIYLLYFLSIIFCISILLYFLKGKDNKPNNINQIINYQNNTILENKKIIIIIFVISLICKYISLLQSILVFGFDNVKGNSFGIFAHLGSISVILSPFLLILYSKKKNNLSYLFLILLLFINLFIFGGKYGIFISLIHHIIFFMMNNKYNIIKTLKTVIFTLSIALLVFVMIYSIIPAFEYGEFNKSYFFKQLSFAFKHFSFYLVSPLIATNYYFFNSIPLVEGIEVLFTVPINIMKSIFMTGDYIYPIIKNKVPVSYEYLTNVGGIFSEVVYNVGGVISTIYISVIFCIVYYIYIKSVYYGKMINLCALLLSIITMSFFSNFLTVFGVVIQIIFLWAIELLLSKKIVFKKV